MLRDYLSHPSTHVPVLMITGYAEKHVVEAARDAGATEFLAKPVTVDGLGARLMSVIENPRQFISSGTFVGPDRRRRQLPVEEDMRQSADCGRCRY
jgi:two-component system chemotaxis response regulator CheY